VEVGAGDELPAAVLAIWYSVSYAHVPKDSKRHHISSRTPRRWKSSFFLQATQSPAQPPPAIFVDARHLSRYSLTPERLVLGKGNRRDEESCPSQPPSFLCGRVVVLVGLETVGRVVCRKEGHRGRQGR